MPHSCTSAPPAEAVPSTDPAFTRRYWGIAWESDWHAGSTVTLELDKVKIADPAQVVLESDRLPWLGVSQVP
jgi:hypothetical protein